MGSRLNPSEKKLYFSCLLEIVLLSALYCFSYRLLESKIENEFSFILRNLSFLKPFVRTIVIHLDDIPFLDKNW